MPYSPLWDSQRVLSTEIQRNNRSYCADRRRQFGPYKRELFGGISKKFNGFETVINCAGIVADSLAGMLFRSQISHALQENLIRAMGLVCLFLGIFGAMAVVGAFRTGCRATRRPW